MKCALFPRKSTSFPCSRREQLGALPMRMRSRAAWQVSRIFSSSARPMWWWFSVIASKRSRRRARQASAAFVSRIFTAAIARKALRMKRCATPSPSSRTFTFLPRVKARIGSNVWAKRCDAFTALVLQQSMASPQSRRSVMRAIKSWEVPSLCSCCMRVDATRVLKNMMQLCCSTP